MPSQASDRKSRERNLSDALNIEHGPISIRFDFGSLIGSGMLGCFLVCGVCAAAIYSDSSNFFLKATALICLIGASGIFLVGGFNYVRMWRNDLPGLILSPDGFIDCAVSPTLIRWTDVENCSLVRVFDTPILYVELKPGVFEQLSISRLLRFAYFRSHTLCFSGSGLDCNFDDLVKCFMSQTSSDGAVKPDLQRI